MVPLSKTDIRRLLLKRPAWHGSLDIGRLAEFILNDAKNEGLVEDDTRPPYPQRPPGDDFKVAIYDVIWELALEGLFVPGSGGTVSTPSATLPFVRVSDYGKGVLGGREISPHDPDGYLKRIQSDSPAVHSHTLLYLGEAIQTFRSRNYLAATVMLGVAGENIFLSVIEGLRVALKDPGKQATFDTKTKNKKVKNLHDVAMDYLKPSTLFHDLKEEIEDHLHGMFNIVRKSRNDSGHPTGRKMGHDEMHGLLLMFPAHSKTAHEVIRRLNDPANSL